MAATKCSRCGFDFEEGVYAMKNKKDYICIFCLKKNLHIDINDLFDNKILRQLNTILDREGLEELVKNLL